LEKEQPQVKVYFQNLDVLRFIAAFMIVIIHWYGAMKGWYGLPKLMRGNFPYEANKTWSYVERAIDNFGYGVDIFFLISGFLITYLLLTEKEKNGRISLRDFYIRRTLRIWPLYYFLIAIGPFLVRWTHSTPQPNYLAQVFFVGNFDQIRTGQWIFPFSHFWSIHIEEHFYLVWPFLVAFIPTRRLPFVFSLVIFISIMFRLILYMLDNHNYYLFYLHSLSRLDVLAIGALLAWRHYKKPWVVNIPGPIRILIYALIVALFCTDVFYIYSSVTDVTFKKYFYLGLITLAMGSFLFGTNNKLAPKKKNIFHYFGKVSYGMYMYNNILVNVVIIKIMAPVLHSVSPVIFSMVYFPLCFIVPILSYELLEKPFLKLKSRFEIIKTSR
jgi:peptidoglycan/LPS O-acetylase OafA/YrhL